MRVIQYAAAFRVTASALGYWVARSSRAMTTVWGMARHDRPPAQSFP
jgi:hypothetical protein